MRPALIFSLVLHVAFALIAIIGLPQLTRPLELAPEPIPIEIVDIGEITNTKIDQPTPEPPKPQPVPSPPKAAEPPPPQQVAQAEPPPPVETPPPPKPEEPKPIEKLPEPEPEPAPTLTKMAALPPPPQRVERPLDQPKKLPPKKPDNSFDSVLKNLDKLKLAETPQKPDKQAKAQPQPPSLDSAHSDRLTITEQDALRRQIAQCWNVDPGARGIQDMNAEIRVWFDPQMRVLKTDFVGGSGSLSDPYFRSFVESAKRAPLKEQCRILQLPREKYANSGTIVINFSPRDML